MCGSSSRRLLDTSSAGSLTNNAAVQHLVALTEFVFGDYASTMEEAKDFNAADVEHTIIMMMSFIVVWCGIIAIVTIKSNIYSTIDTTKKTIITLLKSISDKTLHKVPSSLLLTLIIIIIIIVKVTPDTDDNLKKTLNDYIHSFVPVIYHEHLSPLRRYMTQWMRTHSLSDILSDRDRDSSIITSISRPSELSLIYQVFTNHRHRNHHHYHYYH